MLCRVCLPLDVEPGDTGLFGQHAALDSVGEDLCRGLGIQLLRVVFVVDVVANTDKFSAVVGACEENDGDAEDVGVGDLGAVWGIGLEEELVDADGDRPDKERFELLIILVADEVVLDWKLSSCSSLDSRGGRADVGQLPLQVCASCQSSDRDYEDVIRMTDHSRAVRDTQR